VVLLTGCTGNLGNQILSRLLKEKSVHLVYALNRCSIRRLLMGSQKRFLDKGLDSSMLHADKMVFLEVENTLLISGLSDEVYDEVRNPYSCFWILFSQLKNDVTIIIHNAWILGFQTFPFVI
ncbi:hypothetical protein F5051DRAFT_339344, partial [Lentinula edodes]